VPIISLLKDDEGLHCYNLAKIAKSLFNIFFLFFFFSFITMVEYGKISHDSHRVTKNSHIMQKKVASYSHSM